MRTIDNIIKDLKNLDLSKYPEQEIKDLISETGVIGHMGFTLHPNKSIFRARLNENDESFYSKCQLTYKPQHFNNTFQRASTPNKTMFYGSILPEITAKGDLGNTRVVPTYEAIPWLRDKTTKGVRKATFTRWIVTQDIKLIAILQHGNYYDKSSYTKQLMDDYNGFLELYPEQKEKTKKLMSYLSEEYAKDQIKNDYDYLISAVFSEILIDQGIDGVLYPSVRLGGAGFNVALTPQASDLKIGLAVVMECNIYKLYDKTVMDNNYQAILYPNQTHFVFEKVEDKFHAGEEICLKELGVRSIDELQ